MKKIEIGKNNNINDEKIYIELQEIIDKEISQNKFNCFMKIFVVSSVVFTLLIPLLLPLLMNSVDINSINSYFKIVLSFLKGIISNPSILFFTSLISCTIGSFAATLQTIDDPIIDIDTRFRLYHKILKERNYSLFYNCSKGKKKSLEVKFEKIYEIMNKKHFEWFKEKQYSFKIVLTKLSYYENYIQNKKKVIDEFKNIDGDTPIICNNFKDALEYSVIIDGEEITFEDCFTFEKMLENKKLLTKSEAYKVENDEIVENADVTKYSRKDIIDALNNERALLSKAHGPEDMYKSEKKYVLYVKEQ